MNTSIYWSVVGICHLKRPKFQTYTNITLLVLTEDHWSLALFPLRQYICRSYVSVVVSGRAWYGWWVGILFLCNLTRLVRGNLQQMHFLICSLSFMHSTYYILFHVPSHCKTLSLLYTCVHWTLPEWS